MVLTTKLRGFRAFLTFLQCRRLRVSTLDHAGCAGPIVVGNGGVLCGKYERLYAPRTLLATAFHSFSPARSALEIRCKILSPKRT